MKGIVIGLVLMFIVGCGGGSIYPNNTIPTNYTNVCNKSYSGLASYMVNNKPCSTTIRLDITGCSGNCFVAKLDIDNSLNPNEQSYRLNIDQDKLSGDKYIYDEETGKMLYLSDWRNKINIFESNKNQPYNFSIDFIRDPYAPWKLTLYDTMALDGEPCKIIEIILGEI